MKIYDRKIKQKVEVSSKNCPKLKCYWSRPDPGIFSQGVGYRTRTNSNGEIIWLCGTREILRSATVLRKMAMNVGRNELRDRIRQEGIGGNNG